MLPHLFCCIFCSLSLYVYTIGIVNILTSWATHAPGSHCSLYLILVHIALEHLFPLLIFFKNTWDC